MFVIKRVNLFLYLRGISESNIEWTPKIREAMPFKTYEAAENYIAKYGLDDDAEVMVVLAEAA
jgi:hypothetical protein